MKKFEFSQLFRSRPKPTIGVDVGSNSIKIVEFSGYGPNRSVRRIGRAKLPQEAIVDGTIKDPEAVSGALSGLVENLSPKTKKASTSISGYSVIVKRVNVPFDTEQEIEDNLLLEAEKYVPFEIDEVYVDFYILAGPSEGRTGSDIFLVAAKKEIVDEYAKLLESVGLTPSVIDVDAFALGNAFELAFGEVAEPAALIDIGASKTNLNVLIKGTPVFARDMALGGNQITDAISEATGLSIDDAEKAKISGTKDPVLKQEIAQVIREIISDWTEEIKKALDFYRSSAPPEEHPRHVFLSGGSCLLYGIEKPFAEKLNLEVRRLNPFDKIGHDKEINPDYLSTVAPQFVIASGLGIRSSE